MMNPATIHERIKIVDLPVPEASHNNSMRYPEPGKFDAILNDQISGRDSRHDDPFRSNNREMEKSPADYAAQSRPVQDSRTGNEDESRMSRMNNDMHKKQKDRLNEDSTNRNEINADKAHSLAGDNRVKEVKGQNADSRNITGINSAKEGNSAREALSDLKKILDKLDTITAMVAPMPVADLQKLNHLQASMKTLRKEITDILSGKEPMKKNLQSRLISHMKSILSAIDEKLQVRKPELKKTLADFEKMMQNTTKKIEGKNQNTTRHNAEIVTQDKNNLPKNSLPEHLLQNSGEKHDEGIKITVSSDSRAGMDFHSDRNSTPQPLMGNHTARQTHQFREQLQEMINNAKVTVRDSRNGTFEIKLNPKELGNVNVHIGLDQGVVHGRFLVETNEARTLLLENLDYVKEQLENAGISVGEFQVNVRDQKEGPGENDKEHIRTVHLPSEKEEMTGTYHANSSALHNGALNIVI